MPCPSGCAGTGPSPEEVPTISVEPPRTPQQMDRAVQGLVSGRYLWVAFTSVNAVRAVQREVRGVRPRRARVRRGQGRGGGRPDRGRAAGVRRAARPRARPASSRRPACSRTGRSTTRRSTRSTGCSCRVRTSRPRRWWPGSSSSGWEVDDVTAYRTVRAAPPPAHDPRGDQGRRVRRRAVHVVLDRAQPDRDRRQAARLDGDRVHRPADREDRRGARAARRRARRDACRRRRWSSRWPSTAPRCGWPRSRPARRPGGPRSGGPAPGARRSRRPVVPYPVERPRRLRASAPMRRLVASTRLSAGRPRAAGVRQGGHRRTGAGRGDAGRRAAHPRLAAEGRGRGGRGRRRRADAVRHPGGQGRRSGRQASAADGIVQLALRGPRRRGRRRDGR